MKTLNVSKPGLKLDFKRAKVLADNRAASHLSEPTCLSWYDRDIDYESPAHSSDCHDTCEMPGYVEYATSRGGELKVDVEAGRFVFCYRSVDDFVS
jgi:hypothetical protein